MGPLARLSQNAHPAAVALRNPETLVHAATATATAWPSVTAARGTSSQHDQSQLTVH